jgi:hypothetical protein
MTTTAATQLQQRRTQLAKLALTFQGIGETLSESIPAEPDGSFSSEELARLLAGIIRATLSSVLATARNVGIDQETLVDATARALVASIKQEQNKARMM